MNRKDTNYLNIMKGMCIILVVFGHSIVPSMRENNHILQAIWNFIYLFHMPVFFFVSGYLFEINKNRYSNTKEFITKKFQLLMIPYFVYSIISYIGINVCTQIPKLNSILSSSGYFYTNLKNTIIQILTYQQHMDKHIWFVYALFIIFVINIILKKKSTYQTGFFMIVVYMIIALLCNLIFIPDLLIKVSLYCIYFYFGRLFININEIHADNKKSILIVLLFLILAVLQSINPKSINVIIDQLKLIILGFLGIYATIFVSKYIEKNNIFDKVFNFFNIYSYDIYLIHQPFIVSGLCGVLMKFTTFSMYSIVVIGTVIGIVIPIIVSKYILRKNKYLSFLFLGNRM